MKNIEVRDRIVVADKLTQGVLPLYEQELADKFNQEKREFLELLMTNPDGNVHAFTDEMPGILKGILAARSSRSPEPDITEVLWSEFLFDHDFRLGEVLKAVRGGKSLSAVLRTEKAGKKVKTILDEYGDDSVREDASAHVAISNISVAASMEILQNKQQSTIEMSTRYIDWREKDADGHYHYVVPESIIAAGLEEVYRVHMDGLFETYGKLWDPVWEYFVRENPREEGESLSDYKQVIRAAVCDTLRKLLPLGIKTNLVIHAHYRTFSEIIMNSRASRSAEVRNLADQMAAELMKVNPRFIEVVDIEGKGDEWTENIKRQQEVMEKAVPKFTTEGEVARAVNVEVLNGDYRRTLIKAVLAAKNPNLTYQQLEALMPIAEVKLDEGWIEEFAKAMEDTRTNRRHKINEVIQTITLAVIYEGISFSGYKDLNRHRNILFKTQPDWSGQLGYFMPEAILAMGGEVEAEFRQAQEEAAAMAKFLADMGLVEESKNTLTHGLKTNFWIMMGLQEGIWLPELRSIREGDLEYRWFAQEEKRQTDKKMPDLAALGSFVNFKNYTLARREDRP